MERFNRRPNFHMVRLGLKVEGDRSKAGCRSKLHCYTKLRDLGVSSNGGTPKCMVYNGKSQNLFRPAHGPALVWDTTLRLSCREVITHYQMKSYQRWWGYSAVSITCGLWGKPITCDHLIGDSVIPNDRCLFFWALA